MGYILRWGEMLDFPIPFQPKLHLICNLTSDYECPGWVESTDTRFVLSNCILAKLSLSDFLQMWTTVCRGNRERSPHSDEWTSLRHPNKEAGQACCSTFLSVWPLCRRPGGERDRENLWEQPRVEKTQRKLLDLHIEDPGPRGNEPRRLNLTATASQSILNADFYVALFFTVFFFSFLKLDVI